METVPSWFWLVIVCLGQLVVALAVLWYLARRALREDAGAAPRRRRRRSLMRVLEYRLERLLIHPPRWDQVWARVRPYLLCFAGLAIAGFAVWSLVNWLATPSPPPASPAGGLGTTPPFEAITDQMMRAMGMLAPVIGMIGIVVACASIVVGEGRGASLGLAIVIIATFMDVAPRMFDALGGVGDVSLFTPRQSALWNAEWTSPPRC